MIQPTDSLTLHSPHFGTYVSTLSPRYRCSANLSLNFTHTRCQKFSGVITPFRQFCSFTDNIFCLFTLPFSSSSPTRTSLLPSINTSLQLHRYSPRVGTASPPGGMPRNWQFVDAGGSNLHLGVLRAVFRVLIWIATISLVPRNNITLRIGIFNME